MQVTQTNRLQLRWLTLNDAPFIVELLNDPDWFRFIGDKGVRTLDDARHYISNDLMKSYHDLGFGLYLVEQVADSAPIGICGLKKRDGLDYPDLGFAFLPAFRESGFAFEACQGVMTHAFNDTYNLAAPVPFHLLAITTPDNVRSIRLLEKLQFVFVRTVVLPGATTELRLYEVVIEMVTALK
ncbi:MAG: GNAT family N-acetyltransferase [Gemmatimonas sp.]